MRCIQKKENNKKSHISRNENATLIIKKEKNKFVCIIYTYEQ